MVNYVCAFSQSELGKYFECIIISINGMIVMISGIKPLIVLVDSFTRLRAFPDHFKIYTILPIIRIELNSIQAIDRGRLSHPCHFQLSG